jgi:hypothetical protein
MNSLLLTMKLIDQTLFINKVSIFFYRKVGNIRNGIVFAKYPRQLNPRVNRSSLASRDGEVLYMSSLIWNYRQLSQVIGFLA